MSVGGKTFRAFRPSRFALPEDTEEVVSQDRQAQIRIYARRAEVGLPLFDPDQLAKQLTSGQKFAI